MGPGRAEVSRRYPNGGRLAVINLASDYAWFGAGGAGNAPSPASDEPAARFNGATCERHKPEGCNGNAQRVPLPRWCVLHTHLAVILKAVFLTKLSVLA